MKRTKRKGRPPMDPKERRRVLNVRLTPSLDDELRETIASIPRGDGWTLTKLVEEALQDILKKLKRKYTKQGDAA